MSAGSGTFPLQSAAKSVFAQPGVSTVLLFSAGHFFIDLYSGALSIFQPVLIEKLGLSLTQAGILGGALVFSSSVTQPLYGYLSDRYRSPLFSALAPAVAGIFITAMAFASSFPVAVLLAVLGGAGISSFHPQGSAWAAASIRSNRGLWLAVFISSGTLGLALSPALFSIIIQIAGFQAAPWAALPGIAIAGLLLWFVRPPQTPGSPRAGGLDWPALYAARKPLILLYLAVFFRSAVQVTYTQFLAVYFHRERGFTLGLAAWSVTLYLAAGAVGGFTGGRLSDRFGPRRVIMASFALSTPFLGASFLVPGLWSVVCLALGGLILLFTIPVNVLVAQDLVPQSAGTISALMMGFAWGMAGLIFIPFTGWLSDHFSLRLALSTLLVWPVAGFFLTRMLPKEIGR